MPRRAAVYTAAFTLIHYVAQAWSAFICQLALTSTTPASACPQEAHACPLPLRLGILIHACSTQESTYTQQICTHCSDQTERWRFSNFVCSSPINTHTHDGCDIFCSPVVGLYLAQNLPPHRTHRALPKALRGRQGMLCTHLQSSGLYSRLWAGQSFPPSIGTEPSAVRRIFPSDPCILHVPGLQLLGQLGHLTYAWVLPRCQNTIDLEGANRQVLHKVINVLKINLEGVRCTQDQLSAHEILKELRCGCCSLES